MKLADPSGSVWCLKFDDKIWSFDFQKRGGNKTNSISHVNLGTAPNLCSAIFQPPKNVFLLNASQPTGALSKTQSAPLKVPNFHPPRFGTKKMSGWGWQLNFFAARHITNTPFEIMIYMKYNMQSDMYIYQTYILYIYIFVFILAFDLGCSQKRMLWFGSPTSTHAQWTFVPC